MKEVIHHEYDSRQIAKLKEMKMTVYVVITRHMGHDMDEAVFSSRDKAQLYLNNRNSEGAPKINEIEVRGEMESPNKVFTASWYDESSDLHQFEGIYGTFDDAKKAAGEKGMVLGRVIDDRFLLRRV